MFAAPLLRSPNELCFEVIEMILDTNGNARALPERISRLPVDALRLKMIDLDRAIPTPDSINTHAENLLATTFTALDLLNIGLVVCNASGGGLVANQTAERILHERDGLELDREGVLRSTQEGGPQLRELIVRVARSSRTTEEHGMQATLSLPRASGKRALTLLVRSSNHVCHAEPNRQQAAALVMIVDAARPVQASAGELRQLYGLTSMEARLANLLMEGKDLHDCCAELGIRRSTVRMHRRNLFSKTGVRRQTELVSLLMKSIGLGPREKTAANSLISHSPAVIRVGVDR
jgi:DNA-binding CsgD family transcriptional regulator